MKLRHLPGCSTVIYMTSTKTNRPGERKIASREGAVVTLTIERTYRNADPDTVRVDRHDMVAMLVDGIVRWDTNDQVPPADTLDEMLELRGITAAEHRHSNTAREWETQAFLADYRKAEATREITAEEMFEMRAAFGEGAEVVNIITGKTTKL
jgi:hypothetical protein